MFTIDSYRDVLSESSHRTHIISSAWILALALTAAIVLFA